ncbi:MAG: acyltransferase [Desulfosporosinus sp.]
MNIFKRIKLWHADPFIRAEIFKESGMNIGEHCQIFSRVSFGSEPYLIKLGDNVRVTAGVTFITHDGGIYVLRNLNLLENADYFGRITVGNNVFIGVHSIIMPGVNIGDNCVIGAGSIVTKDIPSNSVAAGAPARVKKTIDEYFEKYKDLVDYTKSYSSKDKELYLSKKYNL